MRKVSHKEVNQFSNPHRACLLSPSLCLVWIGTLLDFRSMWDVMWPKRKKKNPKISFFILHCLRATTTKRSEYEVSMGYMYLFLRVWSFLVARRKKFSSTFLISSGWSENLFCMRQINRKKNQHKFNNKYTWERLQKTD